MSAERPLAGVRALFFDLYNTLARFWPPREELQVTASREFGLGVTPEGIGQGYAEADAFMARENAGPLPLRRRSPEAREAFFAEYERLILQGAGVEVGPELAGRVWARVRQIPYDLALFDDVLPGLERLRALGLTLGLISNMNREGQELAASLGLTAHLDFVVTSREVGAEKPHPPIFLAALEKAKVSPEQAAHVGDQYESDVMGARSVGMQPVLMDRFGTRSASSGQALEPEERVPVVRSMAELVALVER